MNPEIRSRAAGERCARRTLIRLLYAASIWRSATTRLLPLCGASAWWVTLLCLLPGFGTAALLRWLMHLTRAATLTEALRAALGKLGAAAACAVLAGLLLVEGTASMTALITLFTQGIGTRGTQLTLAILTGVILLLSMHREGLSRAAHFLRWGMAAVAVLVAAYLLGDAKADHLFPLYGEGRTAAMEAIRAGLSIAWPIALLLTESPQGRSRLAGGILPAFCAAGALLLMTLAIPHEVIIRHTDLAQTMLLAVRFVPNAVKVAAQSLMMLVFFLSIGASAQLASASICMPLRQRPEWLPYVLVAALIATQAADIPLLWSGLERIEPWLLLPLLALAVLALPAALLRRRTP